MIFDPYDWLFFLCNVSWIIHSLSFIHIDSLSGHIPLLLSCGCTFCSACIAQTARLQQNANITCPQCKKSTPLLRRVKVDKQLPPNLFYLGLMTAGGLGLLRWGHGTVLLCTCMYPWIVDPVVSIFTYYPPNTHTHTHTHTRTHAHGHSHTLTHTYKHIETKTYTENKDTTNTETIVKIH